MGRYQPAHALDPLGRERSSPRPVGSMIAAEEYAYRRRTERQLAEADQLLATMGAGDRDRLSPAATPARPDSPRSHRQRAAERLPELPCGCRDPERLAHKLGVCWLHRFLDRAS